ncbi:uncharacterized protein LOC112494295 [Cephus cinctus]|uniref:Uncharacterized protein LOC112494295 n=1 Tax=Cephus cinctus TaxID=211228 RepID=A0AAJ7W0W3_CEPCN|nr:uncharacterized protein LOC112494295 [Cephus cinctus]
MVASIVFGTRSHCVSSNETRATYFSLRSIVFYCVCISLTINNNNSNHFLSLYNIIYIITMFDRCTKCGNLLNTSGNLVIHRVGVASSGMGITLLGYSLVGSIPALIGFKLSGIAAASIAASWQSSIGSVAAGSTFATLQSMGATGAASSLFSSFGIVTSGTGAFYLLSNAASKLGWCKC